MMEHQVCLRCMCYIYPPECTLTVDSRRVCMCVHPIQAQITLTTGNSTTASLTYDWNKQLKIMREWHVTLRAGGEQKQPVPQPFQDAFNDGELEL